MSVNTWGVDLYGAEVTDIKLNEAAQEKFPDSNTIDVEVLDKVLEDHPYLSWVSTGGDGNIYIGLYPTYPWNVLWKQDLMSLTPEEVDEEVNRIINEIAAKPAEPVKLKLEYISTTGWG